MNAVNKGWLVMMVLASASGVRAAEPEPCRWKGIYPTVVTPFRGSCGGVDTVSLEKQIARELQGGVHGLLVLDTIGEGDLVTVDEREQVISTAVRMAFPTAPIIVGIHTRDLHQAQMEVLQAKKLGASAVLVKFLGNPQAQADQVYQFYAHLAAMRALPILYDHYPSFTGLQLAVEDIADILAIPGVAGIKESTLNLNEAEEHMQMCQGLGKAFFTNTALNLTHFLDAGGHGAMCPEAVLLPSAVCQTYDSYQRGQYEEARTLQEQLFTALPILRLKPTLPALTRVAYMVAQDMKVTVPMSADQPQAQLKAALTCLGVPTPAWVKSPLPQLSVRDQRCVKATVCKLRDLDFCEYRRIPPVPYRTCQEPDSGAFLRTGAFQLAPGVSQDLLRSQGDGLQGFPMD